MTREEEIGSQRYLYLTKIFEPEENSLRLVVEAAHADGPEHPINPALPSLGAGRLIVADETTPAWEVMFHGYVAYAVLDESYALPAHEDEVWSGANLFRRYSKSRFLDYVRSCTFADDSHPGPLRHYEIICLNHVVNIVTWYDPEITKTRFRVSPN